VVEQTLASKLKMAWEAGVLKTIGLSIDTFPEFGQPINIEGKRVPVISGFKKIVSVDLVGETAAGGGFERLIAADTSTIRSDNMDEQELKDLVAQQLTETLPDIVQSAVADALKAAADEDVQESETEEEETTSEVDEEETGEDEDSVDEQESEEEEDEESEEEEDEDGATAQDALDRIDQLEAQLMLREKLAESKLPAKFRGIVEDRFPEGSVFTSKEVDGMIKRTREAWSSADTSGRERGSTSRVTMGMNGEDWAAVEFLRLVAGNTSFRALEANEDDVVVDRMPEAYGAWIKSGRPKGNTLRLSEWAYALLGGNPLLDDRAMEAVTTSSMTSIVKNALNVLLAASYSVREQWWDPIVTTEEVDTIDQATLVRVYGLSNLDVVTEGQPYTELDWGDDEETADFVKKGNFVAVTLETLLNDKLARVRTIPNLLADSWYNTLSALNSAVFTVNSDAGPVMGTTGALFNATATTTAGGHANLLTTAVSHAGVLAVRTAMMKQTAQNLGVGRRLTGIKPRYLLTPVDAEVAALQVRNSELYPGADFDAADSGAQTTNILQNSFDVIPVPDWTDVNNWAAVADKVQFPAIYNIFLSGLRVPSLFTADNDAAGAMFTNDTMRFKVRLMTWRFSSTYDCAPVADFRPLHKSNVA
jgi:hypothetical protein